MMIEPAAPASIVASGERLRVSIMGAAIEAAVITPTVVDPVIMFPTIPRTKGRKIGGSPVSATVFAIASTAGVSRRIWLSEPPSPVTMMIIAEARRPSSIQPDVRSTLFSGFVFRYARSTPIPSATTGQPR